MISLKKALKSLAENKSNEIITRQITFSGTEISADGNSTVTVDTTYSGYTCLGCISYNFINTGSGKLVITRNAAPSSTTWVLALHNFNASSVTPSGTIKLLYKKDNGGGTQ